MRNLCTALLIGMTAASTAHAYIPPSSFILKTIAAKHTAGKGVRIRTTVTQMEGEKMGAAHFKEITYFNPQTNVIRTYSYDDNNKKLYAAERTLESATAADALLFWTHPKALIASMKSHGVPVIPEEELMQMKDEEERRAAEKVWFARWANSVAWVIGREPRKSARNDPPSDPQIWIEKDTFYPLRLVVNPENGGSLYDLQMEGQRYYREFPFPRVIMAVRKKDPVLRDEVQEVTPLADTNDFATRISTGFTDAGNSAPGPVKELIRFYHELVR